MKPFERWLRTEAARRGLLLSDLHRVVGGNRSTFYNVISGKAKSDPLRERVIRVLRDVKPIEEECDAGRIT